MTSARLSGVFTALVTPFKADGSIDAAAFRKLVHRQIEGGVAGIVPCGTTGEAVTLSPEEQAHLVRLSVEGAKLGGRRVTVIAGCGSNDTKKAIELGRQARAAGADALLVVTPYYNKPSPAGLLAHYRAIADAVDAPIVIYNVPGRTGLNMLPETILELAEDPRFVGVKEASGSLDQACEILRKRPERFAVLSGEDSLALPITACGGDGVIAVVSNEAPELVSRLVSAALEGSREEAAALQARLLPLMRANFVESNPIPVKWALSRLGLCEDVLRLPLVSLATSKQGIVETALREAGLLAWGPV